MAVGPVDPAEASAQSAVPTYVFRGIPENRRIREVQCMLPEFVAGIGGSQWQSALPTRR